MEDIRRDELFEKSTEESGEVTFDLSDIFKKLENNNKAEQTENREKYSEAELIKAAKSSADFILRNDDFGYGNKRERLSSVFADAANKGPHAVKQLVEGINKELKARNSDLRISGTYQTGTETKDEAVYPKNGEAVHIYPQIYKYTYAGANFSLTNSKTGMEEDSIYSRGRLLSRVHQSERSLIIKSLLD
ncbi:MAG: hypothetical protein K2X27_14825 [Candidatus Obscuribacterales bacterium]|nr:hypothetical protein [Candidatus Obscuribacterales bacterium]